MEGWEISAHRAPSDDHAFVQGAVFTDAEFQKLQSLEPAVDTEGNKHQLQSAIGDEGCKHITYPFTIGVSGPTYSKKELKELLEENEKGIELNGKHYTLFQAKLKAERLKDQITDESDKVIKAEMRSLRKGLKEALETKSIRVK